MEGRVIIIVDGDPMVLAAPYLFLQSFQSPEDYSSRPYYSSFIRLLRMIAFFVSVILPSVYVSALNFHREMIPSELIVNMAEAREVVPFNAISGRVKTAYIPIIKKTSSGGEQITEISGSAVIKGTRMVGKLNPAETKGLLLIRNEVKGGQITATVIPRAQRYVVYVTTQLRNGPDFCQGGSQNRRNLG
ncbi:hypothetical protein J2S00_002647 [Caldalkalibacillus uzonensis]|uniref:Spore germination GerAC-like C-terminal domain-containing protein n=1 Tax=Caldalkalibacillus uzonensis TaxID=353224 RepID=A0ABU0CU33_9BACI|nr:hypothetical protein [Caldalkalibacillus uzonensis]